LLSAGILASLCALSIHGLIDNPLYAEWGRPLQFVLPGMALALTGGYEFARNPTRKNSQTYKMVVIISIVAGLVSAGIANQSMRSAWYANIGAIVMAKSQLPDWPSGQWPEQSMAERLTLAANYFEKSLNLKTTNSTANYRLGLINFYGHNFSNAELYFNKAFQLNNQHRGIQKALGYTYVWLGEFDRAGLFLSSIPEARDELDVYTWWWTARGRTDLAENAKKMIQQIDRES
jgi:tetratricopeptide (TPR) repeat protein